MKIKDDELRAWIALLKCPRLGWITFQKLQQHLADPLQVFTLSKSDIRALPLMPKQLEYLTHPNWQYADDKARWLNNSFIDFVPVTSADYPEYLKQSSRPPIGLFVKGDVARLNDYQLAVVGTRSPTPYGEQVTRSLISQLAGQELTVTSGLAIGVDGIAHQTAIENNIPTLAVMATGFQQIYPRRHQALAEQITECGALVTEFLPDVPPVQHNFPRRNRIIAGLSRGTLVTEAAVKSGSLITAQYAIDEGRDVFAVPGNVFNPLAEGCHQLIQQGAKLIRTAADILEERECFESPLLNIPKKDLAEGKLLASVDHDTTPVDVIVQRSNLPLDQVLMELLDLEVQGAIVAVPGGFVRVT